MDSITHATLGACLGSLMLGKPLGKQAMLWGAVVQNLPDIDGVANLWLPTAEGLLAHRGLTHSLPLGLVAATGLALLAHRWFRETKVSYWQWLLFFGIQIGIHDLLDTTNAYGTGLLEPFSHERFSIHLLYVIDPLFTLPLLISTLVLVGHNHRYVQRRRWAIGGVGGAVLYVAGAFVSKAIASQGIQQSLSAARTPDPPFVCTPTPFNSLLWYAVAKDTSGYHMGYRSVFEKPYHYTDFTFFPQQKSLLRQHTSSAEVDQLVRFANGYYIVEPTGQGLAIDVLRFGQVGGWQRPRAPFVFRYQLNNETANRLVVQRGRFEGWTRPTTIAYIKRVFNQP